MRNTRRLPTFSENLQPESVPAPILLPYVQTVLGSTVFSVAAGAILAALDFIPLVSFAPVAVIITFGPVGILAVRNIVLAFVISSVDTKLTRMRAEYAQQTLSYRDTALEGINPSDPPALTAAIQDDRTIINNRTSPRSDEQIYRQDLREFALEIWRRGGVTARDQYLKPGNHYRFTSGTIMTRKIYARMKDNLVNSNHAATRPDGAWVLVSTPATIRRSIKAL